MDGVSWSTTRPPESFSRSKTTTDTLTRLASFIARADAKQQQAQRPQTTPPSSYVCQECDQGFTRSADLLHHQETTHTLPKPHRCNSCGRGFSLRSSLQLHRCDHTTPTCLLCHGASPLSSPCLACVSRGSDPIRLQNKSPHLQPCLLDNTPYACAPCGRGFSQKQALLHHQQAGCSEPPSPSRMVDISSLPDDSPPASEAGSTHSDSSVGQSSVPSKCEVCSRSFRSKTGLQRHRETSHGEERLNTTQGPTTQDRGGGGGNLRLNGTPVKKPHAKYKLLRCRSCDLVFRSTSRLYLHRKEKHSREKTVRKEPRPMGIRRRRAGAYPCQVCGKVFLHHLSLKAHYRHHSELSYTATRDPQMPDGGARDSAVPENRPDAVRPTSEGSKTIGAGPGRPRKLNSAWGREVPAETQREVPEEEEEEEGGQGIEEEEEEGQGIEEEEEEEQGIEEEEEEGQGIEEEEEEGQGIEEEEEEGQGIEEEEEEFPCPSCPEVFSFQSQLRDHVELHQSSVRWRRCSVCTNAMDTRKRPRSKRQRLYHCIPCQQGFSRLDSFLQHCQEHLRARVEEDCIAEGYSPPASKA